MPIVSRVNTTYGIYNISILLSATSITFIRILMIDTALLDIFILFSIFFNWWKYIKNNIKLEYYIILDIIYS